MLQIFPFKLKFTFAFLTLCVFGSTQQNTCFIQNAKAQDYKSDFHKYQSDEDGFAYEINVGMLAKQKAILPLLDFVDSTGKIRDALGTSIRNVKTFGGAFTEESTNPSTRMFLQSDNVIDGLAILRMNRLLPKNDVPETEEFSGKTYFKFSYRGEEFGFYQPDDKTLVVNSAENVEELVRGRRPKQKLLRSKEWKNLDGYLARVGVGESIFEKSREQYKAMQGRGMPSDPIMELVTPLNENIEKAFAGVKLDKDLFVRVSLYGKDSSAAKEIDSSLQALLTIGKSMLGPVQEGAITATQDENEKKIMVESFKILNDLIKSIEFKRIGREVLITTQADYKSFVKNVLPDALATMRVAARRTQSANNLKQLSLSMHNYHDANKGFPPAVVIGPKGHRHSWRVAVLPYIEEGELYKQYRFDEPWDSPNNTKVMKQMPEVFRHPNDPVGSTNTRYLALTGPGTVFSKEGEKASFGDITDGSSNTIMFLSGESNVPWTKPEDITYDPEKDISMENLPFKNGFNASMFDGSVQFFPKDLDPKTLHLMIQSSDGNPIPRNQ